MRKRPFVDPPVRQAIICLLQNGQTYLEAAQAFGIGSATVNRIWRRYRLTGEHTLGPRGGGRRQAIPPSQHPRFHRMVDRNNDATYPELVAMWHRETGKKVSRSVVVRLVKKLGFSRKKKTIRAKALKQPKNAVKRSRFKKAIRAIPAQNLVFLDESGFQRSSRRAYARSLLGKRAFSFANAMRSANISICGAIRSTGVVAMEGQPRAMTRKWFLRFLRKRLFPRMKPNDVLVLDNLSAHRGRTVRDLARQWSIRLLYLPPYCPEFNPIEMVWAWMKNRLRSRGDSWRENFRHAIAEAWRAVATIDLQRMTLRCLP